MKATDNMRKFSKSHKLDHVCYDIRGPVLEKASEMESAGTKILKLNIGNPAPFNFSAPDEIIPVSYTHLTLPTKLEV